MFYPKLNNIPLKRYRTSVFDGLVESDSVPEDSFRDMKNLTSSKYPHLAVREKRGRLCLESTEGEIISSFTYKGKGITAAANAGGRLCICSETEVFIDGEKIEGAVLSSASSYRSIIPFGRNIFIAPDGVYIKTLENGFEVLCCSTSLRCVRPEVYFCNEYGNYREPTYIGNLPETANPGETAVIHEENTNVLYEYEADKWVEKGELYLKISVAEDFSSFYPEDCVNISSDGLILGFDEYRVLSAGQNYIMLKGILFKEGVPEVISVKKKFPALDSVIEFNNRLWGCRYGFTDSGFVNEIYASKLGDPTKWYSFEGISTDSYCAGLGCSGEFTGCAKVGSELLFFKEEYIIRVTGSSPSDFTVRTVPARGVENGAFLSITNLNEMVFYKSPSGIAVYDGNLPFIISGNLSSSKFFDAVSGSAHGKYFIAMTDFSGNRNIFVYDTKTGMWHKEDDLFPTKFMVELGGRLYFIKLLSENGSGDEKLCEYGIFIQQLESHTSSPEIFSAKKNIRRSFYSPENVEWFAETGRLGENENPGRLILRNINLSMRLYEDSDFSLYIQPDSSDEWIKLISLDRKTDGVVNIPVAVPSCHSFRLRFEGSGGFTLYSLVRAYEKSGEVKIYGR